MNWSAATASRLPTYHPATSFVSASRQPKSKRRPNRPFSSPGWRSSPWLRQTTKFRQAGCVCRASSPASGLDTRHTLPQRRLFPSTKAETTRQRSSVLNLFMATEWQVCLSGQAIIARNVIFLIRGSAVLGSSTNSCPRWDSNPQCRTASRFTVCRVYQFHHRDTS